MRPVLLVLALGVSLPLAAQDAGKERKPRPAAKKPVAGSQKAHHQPSRDQIRKFNELEKKQQK